MYQEHAVLAHMYKDCKHNLEGVFSYNHFRLSWYHYLRLLDVNVLDGFECSLCGEFPSVVIMDATDMAFRKDFLEKSLFPADTKDDHLPLRSGWYVGSLLCIELCVLIIIFYALLSLTIL